MRLPIVTKSAFEWRRGCLVRQLICQAGVNPLGDVHRVLSSPKGPEVMLLYEGADRSSLAGIAPTTCQTVQEGDFSTDSGRYRGAQNDTPVGGNLSYSKTEESLSGIGPCHRG